MALNLDYLTKQYFFFDEPVPYKLKNGKYITISPVILRMSEIFLSSIDILMIDKNVMPDARIIQMSYLEFIYKILLQDEKMKKINEYKIANVLNCCLNFQNVSFQEYENGKIVLREGNLNIEISPKEFEEIKTIILHQNLYNYDDSYISPEVKETMIEIEQLKNRNLLKPSLERKIAIITSHTGISKKEQMSMTYRSHSVLFEEVCGEIDYVTTRPIALYTGQIEKMENWIYKKKKNKFDEYFMSSERFSKSMGGDGKIKSTNTSQGDLYSSQLNSFNK